MQSGECGMRNVAVRRSGHLHFFSCLPPFTPLASNLTFPHFIPNSDLRTLRYPMPSIRSVICPLLLLAAAFASGCNSHRTFPVNGTAKLKGGGDVSRLTGYTVSFEATEPGPDGKIPSATGEIDAKGKFLLSTNATNDGCYLGTYKVALTPPIPPPETAKPPVVIHPKYSALKSTDLQQTIEAKTNEIELELDPAGM